MKGINAIIPRGVQVLLIMAILAVMVIQFSPDNFFYYSIGIALLVAILAVFAIYRTPRSISDNEGEPERKKSKRQKKSRDEGEVRAEYVEANPGSDSLETAPVESDAVPIKDRFGTSFRSPSDKPSGVEVAARYYRMAAIARAEEEERNNWSPKPITSETKTEELPAPEETPLAGAEDMAGKGIEATAENKYSEPAMPLINDETSLTKEDKSDLENAVWYRCENPYCKYTHFLDVHHIIDEKNGGTNKLDNLIVLCPYCHDLAHRNEIPEEELRLWINHREERFKFKLQWRYI